MRQGSGDSRGFTLLELMLAISIFALVVVVLFSSFWAGIGAWEKGEQRIEFQQRMRSVCELLFREVSAAYPYFLTPSQLDKHTTSVAFFGEANSLRFVSYANLHKRASGLCMLEFWVSEHNGLMLGEAAALVANKEDFDAAPLRSPENALAICPELRGLQFQYFDRKKDDDPGEWIEQWDPAERRGYMPRIIRVTLTFSDPRGERLTQQMMIPIMSSLQK
ncbi:MAG: prepilin-type N-terminal cleavage/methylation domain-containing protein [Proteobacteria bacterium]|nr:prepilin-type N-terminal cleavage/methylation domain-containing protein [Pseudomonadota bacterium]